MCGELKGVRVEETCVVTPSSFCYFVEGAGGDIVSCDAFV
jgi:hypothetical protein